MEIRTCEQYVLAELDKAHNKIDELIDKNIEKETKLIEAEKTIDELDGCILNLTRRLELVLGHIDVEESHLHFYIWSGDNDYDIIKEFINERESDSEE